MPTRIDEEEKSGCDLCGKRFWFREGAIYWNDGEPELVCPECIEAKETASKPHKLDKINNVDTPKQERA